MPTTASITRDDLDHAIEGPAMSAVMDAMTSPLVTPDENDLPGSTDQHDPGPRSSRRAHLRNASGRRPIRIVLAN